MHYNSEKKIGLEAKEKERRGQKTRPQRVIQKEDDFLEKTMAKLALMEFLDRIHQVELYHMNMGIILVILDQSESNTENWMNMGNLLDHGFLIRKGA